MMTEDQSLSDFWRVRRSAAKPVELKVIMEDLTSLVGSVVARGKSTRKKHIKVLWSDGMSPSCVNESQGDVGVTIDTRPLQDASYPISGDILDVLSGMALHEASHVVNPTLNDKDKASLYNAIWQTIDQGNYFPSRQAISDASKKYHDGIYGVIDDIVADYALRRISPATGAYVDIARKHVRSTINDAIEATVERCTSTDVPVYMDDVLNLWGWMSLYDEPLPSNLRPEIVPILADLMEVTDEVMKRKNYARNAIRVWNNIKGFALSGKQEQQQQQQGEGEKSKDGAAASMFDSGEDDDKDDEEGDGDGGSGEQDDEEESDKDDSQGVCDDQDEDDDDDEGDDSQSSSGSGASSTSTSSSKSSAKSQAPELISDIMNKKETLSAEDVEDVLASIDLEREDISSKLGIPQSGYGTSTVLLEKFPYDRQSEQELLSQGQDVGNAIAYILSRWKRRRTKWSRGKDNGTSLDRHLLYRGGLQDNHVFKVREIRDKLDMGLCLLLDESSSVRDEQWKIIMQTAGAFASAMGHRDDIDLMMMGYSTNRANNTVVRRVWDSDRVLRMSQDYQKGSTPTAYALAAIRGVVMRRFTKHQDRIIIHITDGQPNGGPRSGVRDEVRKCRDAGIYVACVLVLPGDKLSYYYDRSTDVFKKDYGDAFRRVQSFDELPNALEDMLRDLLDKR